MGTSCRHARDGHFCGYCYAGRKGRAVYRGHWGWRPPRRVRKWSGPMKRPSAFSGGGAGKPLPPDPGTWQKSFPTLVQFLSDATWEDGTSRLTGTCLLFAEDGAWKACLRDREVDAVAFVSAKTPGDLLGTVERLLASDACDWRKSKPNPAKKRPGG